MAVKLRLRRMGGRQKPFYRIVAADSRFPRDGRFIEVVGTYNPIKMSAATTLISPRNFWTVFKNSECICTFILDWILILYFKGLYFKYNK